MFGEVIASEKDNEVANDEIAKGVLTDANDFFEEWAVSGVFADNIEEIDW